MTDTDLIVQLAGADPLPLWLLLRGQDVSGDDEGLSILMPWLRERCARFFSVREKLAEGLFVYQDVTDAAFAFETATSLPILKEHLQAGSLIVGDAAGRRLLPPPEAARLFGEALCWCGTDYADLFAEFGDMVRQHLAQRGHT